MGNVAKLTLQLVINGILERGLVVNDPQTGVLVLTEKGEEWWKRAQAEAPVDPRAKRVMDVYSCIENPAWMGYKDNERCGRCAGCINLLKAQAEPFELQLTQQEMDDVERILSEEE